MILDIEEGNYQPDVLTEKINTLSLPLELETEDRKRKISFVRDRDIREVWFLNDVVPQEINKAGGKLLVNGKEINYSDLFESLKAKNNYKPERFYKSK
jgi:hypothetical protein